MNFNRNSNLLADYAAGFNTLEYRGQKVVQDSNSYAYKRKLNIVQLVLGIKRLKSALEFMSKSYEQLREDFVNGISKSVLDDGTGV